MIRDFVWKRAYLISAVLLALSLVGSYALKSEAQSTDSVEHRQTRALEKIAKELERIRRCRCKCAR